MRDKYAPRRPQSLGVGKLETAMWQDPHQDYNLYQVHRCTNQGAKAPFNLAMVEIWPPVGYFIADM